MVSSLVIKTKLFWKIYFVCKLHCWKRKSLNNYNFCLLRIPWRLLISQYMFSYGYLQGESLSRITGNTLSC